MKTTIDECVRCGEVRIFSKSWNEFIGNSLVTYTISICPDSVCQKIVDGQLKAKKIYLDTILSNSLKRRAENRKNRKYLRRVS